MREVNLEFYVLNYNWNENKVVNYNIFNNIHVYEFTIKAVKKYLRNQSKYSKTIYGYGDKETKILYGKEAFVEELRSIIQWQEWSRREYEISVGDAFESDINKMEKWDCYQQFLPNKELVADYVINQYRKFKKKTKRKDGD